MFRGDGEVNSWRLKMKTHNAYCLHFTSKLACRALVGVKHTYNTRCRSGKEIHYLFGPWEEPCTISHGEPALPLTVPLHLHVWAFCHREDLHSLTFLMLPNTQASSFTHTCAHSHTRIPVHSWALTRKWSKWQSSSWFSFWQLVANVTFVHFIFHCWGMFCVATEPSRQMKRE